MNDSGRGEKPVVTCCYSLYFKPIISKKKKDEKSNVYMQKIFGPKKMESNR